MQHCPRTVKHHQPCEHALQPLMRLLSLLCAHCACCYLVALQVVREAAVRLQDYDDKVRIAAVKSVCQCARQLLAGPAGAASGGTAATAGHPQSAVGTLLDSQEEDEAAAAELGVAYTPPEKELDLGFGAADAAAGVAAGTRDVAWLQDVLKGMCMRLRDTKVSVRKQTASSLMAVFRTVAAAGEVHSACALCCFGWRWLDCGGTGGNGCAHCWMRWWLHRGIWWSLHAWDFAQILFLQRSKESSSEFSLVPASSICAACAAADPSSAPTPLPAGTGEQLAKYCWLPARMLLCCKSDVELRAHLIEGVMRDGLLGPQALPAQAAAAWVQLWLAANAMDRETLMVMLAMRARLQVRAARHVGCRLQDSVLRRRAQRRRCCCATSADLKAACLQLFCGFSLLGLGLVVVSSSDNESTAVLRSPPCIVCLHKHP